MSRDNIYICSFISRVMPCARKIHGGIEPRYTRWASKKKSDTERGRGECDAKRATIILSYIFIQTQSLRLNGTHRDRATHNSDIPDFSSTVVPLPATYETAFISPRNNNTTLHMFPRYSSRKYSSRKKLRPTSRERVHFSL